SVRKAADALGLDHVRVLRWLARAALDQLADAKPGPEVALHALLDWERQAVVKLAEEWGEVDLSHRKLAHRGSRLDLVHVSESTGLRVLSDAGLHLPGRPARPPRQRQPFPDGGELVPGGVWLYEFPHLRAAQRC